MGLFDAFRRKPWAPDEVRKYLFDLVAAGNSAGLVQGCTEHEAVVLAHFAAWRKIPDEFRTPDKLNWYAPGLIAVAQQFAKTGHPELMATLQGPAQENPVTRWQETLRGVDAIMGEGRYREAAATVNELLATARQMSGTAVDEYLPFMLGRLGECLFQSGDAPGAVVLTEEALARCEARRDGEGVVSYLGNLYENHRYQGDGAAAVRDIERLITVLEQIGNTQVATSWRRQLAVVKRGEPLCRVVITMQGRKFEVSEAPTPEGSVQFHFERNRSALRPSVRAVADGVKFGEAGNFDDALVCFERASAADKFNPWPHYHRGSTLLHLRRYDEGVEALATTERLAPGFYHCRSDGWLAEQLASRQVAHETFVLVRKLFDGQLPPEQVEQLARRGIENAPLGLLFLALGDALRTMGRKAEWEEVYRKGLEVAEEPDVTTRLLAHWGASAADVGKKQRLLREAVELQGNLVAAAQAALTLAALPRN